MTGTSKIRSTEGNSNGFRDEVLLAALAILHDPNMLSGERAAAISTIARLVGPDDLVRLREEIDAIVRQGHLQS